MEVKKKANLLMENLYSTKNLKKKLKLILYPSKGQKTYYYYFALLFFIF